MPGERDAPPGAALSSAHGRRGLGRHSYLQLQLLPVQGLGVASDVATGIVVHVRRGVPGRARARDRKAPAPPPARAPRGLQPRVRTTHARGRAGGRAQRAGVAAPSAPRPGRKGLRATVSRRETGSPSPPAASRLRSTSGGDKAWAAGDAQRHVPAPESRPGAVTGNPSRPLGQTLYTSGLCPHLVPVCVPCVRVPMCASRHTRTHTRAHRQENGPGCLWGNTSPSPEPASRLDTEWTRERRQREAWPTGQRLGQGPRGTGPRLQPCRSAGTPTPGPDGSTVSTGLALPAWYSATTRRE